MSSKVIVRIEYWGPTVTYESAYSAYPTVKVAKCQRQSSPMELSEVEGWIKTIVDAPELLISTEYWRLSSVQYV